MNRLSHAPVYRQLARCVTCAVLLVMFFGVVDAAEPRGGGVPEGKPDPELLEALEQKKREAERLRQRVKELEALLRMKNEISEAKSRAIEQLEAARKKKAGKVR